MSLCQRDRRTTNRFLLFSCLLIKVRNRNFLWASGFLFPCTIASLRTLWNICLKNNNSWAKRRWLFGKWGILVCNRTPGKSRTGFRRMDVYLQKFGCYHKDSKRCLWHQTRFWVSLGAYSNFRVNVPGMHYVNEGPHKDSCTCMCVCVCEVVLISWVQLKCW